MPINPQFLVRDSQGRPQPPEDLVRRLRRLDPRIRLFYLNVSWAIVEDWKETDPRRRRIQEGDMAADMAFDICGYLPLTCSVDEAPAYIERELRSYSPQQFAALRETVKTWNDVEQDNQLREVVLGAVSDELDKGNHVTGGISERVLVDLKSAQNPIPTATGNPGKHKVA